MTSNYTNGLAENLSEITGKGFARKEGCLILQPDSTNNTKAPVETEADFYVNEAMIRTSVFISATDVPCLRLVATLAYSFVK